MADGPRGDERFFFTIRPRASAGGGTDLVARALAPYLEKYLGGGAKFVIVNRAGAGGEVGFTALANAPADGYTIGFVNTPPLMTIPIERAAQFGGPQRFELLGNIVDDPCNFAVHSDTPVRTLQELAAYARANPGKVTVGTTGIGSDDHLLMLMFERAAGVKMTHVPFKGSADVRTALASKQIEVPAINVGESLQAVPGGAAARSPQENGVCPFFSHASRELVALRMLFVVRLEHGGAASVERKPQRLRRPADAIGGELQRLVLHAPVRLLAGRLLDQAAAREDQALHIAIAADVVGEAAPGVPGKRLAEPLVVGSGLGLGFREAQLARAPRVRLSTQVGLHEHDAQLLAVETTRQVEQAEAVARGAAQAFGLDARLHLQAAAAVARERAADPALRILSEREHHGAPGSVRRSVGAAIVLWERRSAGEQTAGQAGD